MLGQLFAQGADVLEPLDAQLPAQLRVQGVHQRAAQQGMARFGRQQVLGQFQVITLAVGAELKHIAQHGDPLLR